MSSIKPGVATGDQVQEIFKLAKKKQFALPAVNVIGSSSINAVLETSKELNSPVIIQFSNGGAVFNAGKSLDNANQNAAIAGAIAGAKHIHTLAKAYDVPIILHTDHCAKKLLPWLDGLIEASEEHYKEKGYPLYSSHMIDLSEEPIEENIAICKKYLERMSKIGMTLEIELGITGGEEEVVEYRRIQNLVLEKSFTIYPDAYTAFNEHILFQKQQELLYRVKDFRFSDWVDLQLDSDVLMGRLLHNRIGYSTLQNLPMLLGLKPKPWIGEMEKLLLEKFRRTLL
mgnify:CR=1 FL=1